MKKLVRTAEWIVVVMGAFIGLFILTEKMCNSFNASSKEYNINLLHFLLAGLIYAVLFFVICILNRKIQSERKSIIVSIIITVLFEVIFCFSLILGAGLYYSSDAGVVYNLAVRFLKGDYSAVMPRDSYLAIHPQQYGMIFIFEMIMKVLGTTNGMIFQLMNIVLVVLGTLSGYGIVWRIQPRRSAIIGYSILQITFFPLYFFVAVAYGDLPATCLTTMAVYLLIQIFDKKKFQIVWGLLASFVIILDCMFKRNALICLIAIVLTSIVMFLKDFDIKRVLWLLITVFLAVMAVPFVQKTYEIRAGQESGKGMPMVTYIAMSMQQGLGAPGAWSGYHTDLYLQNDYDYDATSEQAKEDIKESLSGFLSDPQYMMDFYIEKVAYQWTEGTFDGIGWGIGNGFAADKSPWVENIYNGDAHAFFEVVANGHQCVVYLAFTLSTIFGLNDVKKKRELCFAKMVLIVIVIGGFLFELIWESSSRYVMMYYAMMLPIAAEFVSKIYEKLRGDRFKKTY